MAQPDQTWSELLTNAIDAARSNGRHHVADYLLLRASNDEIRSAGVKALFDAVAEVVAEKNDLGANIRVELTENHNFQYRNANMPGSRIEFRIGIRCLAIEAGWTRTPSDGFMRGGALAVARLTHFGMKKATNELNLIRKNGRIDWMTIVEDTVVSTFKHEHIRGHIELLTG